MMLWTAEVTYHDRHGMEYAASLAVFNCCFGQLIRLVLSRIPWPRSVLSCRKGNRAKRRYDCH